jgi:hypothetical protein
MADNKDKRQEDRKEDRRDRGEDRREDRREDHAGRPPTDPDYGKPVGPDHPDQGLPGSGNHPSGGPVKPGRPTDPDYGKPESGRPDQGLPGDLPKPGDPNYNPDLDPDLNPNLRPGLHPDQGLPKPPGTPNRPDQGLPPSAGPKKKMSGSEDEDRIAPTELLDQIGEAEKVEVGFTDADGEELEGVPRQEIPAGRDSWRVNPGGLGLATEKLQVFGPGPSGTPVHTIEGYSLFIDGSEVAHVKRPTPLAIEPGMTFDLRNDFQF